MEILLLTRNFEHFDAFVRTLSSVSLYVKYFHDFWKVLLELFQTLLYKGAVGMKIKSNIWEGTLRWNKNKEKNLKCLYNVTNILDISTIYNANDNIAKNQRKIILNSFFYPPIWIEP